MMDSEKRDDAPAADTSMISNSSPYQPTTEPVSDRTPICAGFILDVMYVKSLPGILKVVEMVICIIILICVGSASCGSSCTGIFFLRSVSIWALVFTMLIYIIFALTFHTKLAFIHWQGTDFFNSLLDAIFTLIASITLAATGTGAGTAAAVVFGLANVIAFGASTWLVYRNYRSGNARRSNVSHTAGVQG